MIGVFKGSERIGSILYFVSHKGWVAYAKDASEQFKTRKEAIAWIVTHANRASPSSAEGRD